MSFFDRFKRQHHRGARGAASRESAKSEAEKEAPKAAAAKPAKDDSREAYRLLLYPVVSEKAARIGEKRQYVFVVPPSATKIEIKRAVNSLYGIWPEKVTVIRVEGKSVRFGRKIGKQKDWKKAMVILPVGKTISVYEGV